MEFVCIHKIRDRHGNILDYIIGQYDEAGYKVCERRFGSKLLKDLIFNNNIKVSNLKLTVDGRLIDTSEPEPVPKPNFISKLLDNFNLNNSTEQYLVNKINSKRVGKAITRALIIGASCAMLSTGVACGTPMNFSAQTFNTSVETAVNNEESSIDKINNAESIHINLHNVKIASSATLSVGDEAVCKFEGKLMKAFDTTTIKDLEGNTLSTGDKNMNLIADWGVYDKDGVLMYQAKESIMEFTPTWIIQDSSGNDILKIEKKVIVKARHYASIVDMEGNLVAKIEKPNSGLFRDFTITVLDNSKIENIHLANICTNYIINILVNNK